MRIRVTTGCMLLLLGGTAQAQMAAPAEQPRSGPMVLQGRSLPPLDRSRLQAGSFDARAFDPLGMPPPAPQRQLLATGGPAERRLTR